MVAFDSYLEALAEGFYRGNCPIKTPDEIAEIKGNPQAHFDVLNDNTTREMETPSGETFMTVPHESLWLTAEDVFIGEVSFRHELNELLADFGGHVGYGIRPSMAGQGYATLGMELVKKRARSMGIDKMLVTCSPDNPASQRVIENVKDFG